MNYSESVVDLVGNTPLVKLGKVAEGIKATVLVKVEYMNPGGSTKDRIATRIIDAAEASGDLKPGGTIVEPTSGNTGVGLAMVAQQRGYRCVFVCPDKVSEDKRSVLKAYGAEVVVAPTNVNPDSPESYYSVSDRLAREIPGAFKPNQYFNLNGPLAHYETTGPEIWRDTEGKVTHYVAGVGTGGTISGTGKYLKEVSDGKVQVIGADPEGSVFSGGDGRPYLVEGVGEDFWPGAYDASVVDRIIEVTDAESFAMTRKMAKEEGLLIGGSSGMAVVAGLKLAAELDENAVVVIILPDGGRGYMTKIFNDDWMFTHGFLAEEGVETVADVLKAKNNDELYYVSPDEQVGDAIKKIRDLGVSQLLVLKRKPPVVLGEVAGTVSEIALLEAVGSGSVSLTDPIEKVTGPVLRLIGVGESVAKANTLLHEEDALLALRDGKPAGVLTRQDLLTNLK